MRYNRKVTQKVMAPRAGSSQDFIPIEDVREGILILKDGSMRAILMASSINFALKSEDERRSILLQFQNFLNSLDFSAQIVIQSRELDIHPYIALLREQLSGEMNELMKIQTTQYIEFIKDFTQKSNIMTKSFYVVIPYTPAVINAQEASTGFFGKIFGSKTSEEETKRRATESFENNRTQIEQRVAVVHQGLSSTGVRSIQLGTEEVLELYYRIFNPGEGEQLANS